VSEGSLHENPPVPHAPEGSRASGSDTRQRTLVALSKIGLALKSQAWKGAAPRGLNPTQAQVLVTLARESGAGLRLNEIAERLAVSPPTVSDSVSALERKGLLLKRPAPDDRRAVAVTLTTEGHHEARAAAVWPDLMLSSVDVLDDAERAVLLRALVKMIRELQEQELIAPSRMCVTCRFFRPNEHAGSTRPHHCAFVDAPFGDAELRVECGDHDPADERGSAELWRVFAGSEAR
jgi:DNA-binding MarR family transcriptional regulator